MIVDAEIILYSLLGGIIPALFWLKFWLKEETHMEPRGLILGTFIGGMLIVFLAVPLERFTSKFFEDFSFNSFLLWSAIEEILKFGVAYFVALKTRFADEPIDAVLYLITAALGFAALENTLFLIEPIADGNLAKSVATLNLRFIGASLLHVLSSGIVGLAIAQAFYHGKIYKTLSLIAGLSLSILLHAMFNHLIIKNDLGVMFMFTIVWVGIISVIIILEKIKKIKNIQHS